MSHRQSRPHRPQLPTGWRRFGAWLPILLFRGGLGRAFGKRLLLLHHTGRVSGLDRCTVLEVVEHDAAHVSWIVASGFGPMADWYRNLHAEPKTVIQVGNRHRAVTAQFLTPDDGAEIMAGYAQRHPRTAQRLCTFMGLPGDGSEAGFRDAGRSIPFVRLDADTDPRLP
ncbi:nitroreductase family deazaflavin-dependent oxidoreductase [Streptomyces sp. NBC_00989]|uniref:nitroreductase family deazaflavin-dependent oxidoreductase n=1 Tax=Streptomyces sp. NBC_00989 TaxID=2903705 RepID=UPI00386470DC|nr:nitroreductase family deazaflavin-dependent oxidoreductase [Streptomyces sp. NBC_00989]